MDLSRPWPPHAAKLKGESPPDSSVAYYVACFVTPSASAAALGEPAGSHKYTFSTTGRQLAQIVAERLAVYVEHELFAAPDDLRLREAYSMRSSPFKKRDRSRGRGASISTNEPERGLSKRMRKA